MAANLRSPGASDARAIRRKTVWIARVRAAPLTEKGARLGALQSATQDSAPCQATLRGAARGRLRRRCGGRRGGVLELLLGAEQRVQDLLAQALGERERDPAADEAEQQDATEAAAALLLRRLVEGDAGVAEVLRRLLDVLLELLVFEDLLRGRLAVAQALERVAAGCISLKDVLAEVLVVHDTLDVGVVARLQGRLLGLGGLLLRCHTTLSRCQVPG